MGTEGFSHAQLLPEMNPILGNKREYVWMLAVLGLLPFLVNGRKSNEDGLRSHVKTTNRYAKMDLDEKSSQLTQL